MNKVRARRIALESVEEIIRDINRRGGLMDTWCGIEKGTQKEIKETWVRIIVNYCTAKDSK